MDHFANDRHYGREPYSSDEGYGERKALEARIAKLERFVLLVIDSVEDPASKIRLRQIHNECFPPKSGKGGYMTWADLLKERK